MDQIKCPLPNASLRKSLVLYVAVFAMIAILLSAITAAVCHYGAEAIRSDYPLSGEKFYLTNEQGEQFGDGAYIGSFPIPLSERDKYITDLLEAVPVIATPVYSALCIIGAAFLFYQNKLKKPLTMLRTASEKIADNDLDFSIEYDSRDELGQLCQSFEMMRATLTQNFSEMWRQVEERKQLNAAFAHDLRTPLTVLKGYNELLQASGDAQTQETAATMEKHISRMEAYISSMSRLRRLEDTKPECKSILAAPFLASLRESAEIVCGQNGKNLTFQNHILLPKLTIDAEFVSQVSNNLLANASRYAQTTVTLSLDWQSDGLLLTVADDGKGFDAESLHKATSPYFTEETDRAEHFGLGLYISRLLCENHGGWLRIDDSTSGAKVSAFFKSWSV